MQAIDWLLPLEIPANGSLHGLNDLVHGGPPDSSGNPRETPIKTGTQGIVLVFSAESAKAQRRQARNTWGTATSIIEKGAWEGSDQFTQQGGTKLGLSLDSRPHHCSPGAWPDISRDAPPATKPWQIRNPRPLSPQPDSSGWISREALLCLMLLG